jgi:hypothetical protein
VSDQDTDQPPDPEGNPADRRSGRDAMSPPASAEAAAPPRPRPIIERIGLGAVALLLASLFGLMAVAAFAGGELFLAVMSGIGCLMVVWVGGLTLLRGR